VFRPLVIPRTLQKDLPYKDKPKKRARNEKQVLESGRIAVIREPHENRVSVIMVFQIYAACSLLELKLFKLYF
jgi:ribosome biogenesis protein BMS1